MKFNSLHSRYTRLLIATALGVILSIGFATSGYSQPIVTVRFANPTYNCALDDYCVDVEFICNTPGQELFGMNVRFFYDDSILELIGFSGFQGGYGAVAPNPPEVATSASAGPALFNFNGAAEFINGAVQLVNGNATPLILDDNTWTKLYQICFAVDDPNADQESFCPPIVWDLEQNPMNGGFLTGDDGVVLTLVDPNNNNQSVPTTENVEQFNWNYTGSGMAPYGQPAEEVCIGIGCGLLITCPGNLNVECNQATTPAQTGTATATDVCPGNPVITYNDVIIGGICPQEFTILRSWFASNSCNMFDTCVQTIMVVDNTPPTLTCPGNLTIACPATPNFGSPAASDICDALVQLSFVTQTFQGMCPDSYSMRRTWTATDDCGNSSSCSATITVQDIVVPTIVCPANVTIFFPASSLPAATGTATGSDNCDASVSITYSDASPNGICPSNNVILRTWVATDNCANSSSCQQSILIRDHGSICGKVADDLGNGIGNVEVKLFADVNGNQNFDTGDTLVSVVLSNSATGNYCFPDIKPCQYILKETQPAYYSSLFDYDFTPDPDGNDSLQGPDNEIPVTLGQGESDLDNKFIDKFECTLLVVNTNDSGPGSLRYMIDCAVNGNTIGFANSLQGQTILITSTKIVIGKDLFIRSTVNPRIRIASQIPGLFDISAGKVVEFKDLNITSGITGNPGAAFHNFGTLNLVNIRILKNPSLPAGDYLIRNNSGGIIKIFGNGSLLIN